MLPAALRRHVGYGAFEDFKQCLLHAFAGNIARDGGIFVFPRDLVDLVDVNDSLLAFFLVPAGILQQLEDNILDIFPNIARFRQRGCVNNGKRDGKHLGQRLGQ